ncbi:cytochrome P450 [Paenibacillus lactis]|uniref:Cytochrome P450 n=2 Tax=Paenibacillus lactis TaxID=228574 RepID=G4HG27_9BACL|nr:cytochrome P450 [Paenibacillus lactis]EHB64038.1 cytochrome P450 [Paenibacillus lactis 154]MBP1895317.1 fatty-acid peroxygenase [Paenibacillus lactis]HAF97795.1 cytochrome P450 [Paenibacillus lactis]
METSRPIPKEEGIDNSLSVLREGYLYVTNRAIGFQSDIFETRLLGERAICMRGEEAAKLFYDGEKFQRHGAAPKRVLKTLFGENGVQTLDGEEHRHRKAMFMSIMNRDGLLAMREITRKQWMLAVERFEELEQIVIYDEAKELLCRAACEWAGIPISGEEVKEKTEWLGAMIESAAAIGIKHRRGRMARSKAEQWLEGLVLDVREGRMHPANGTALSVFSKHRDLAGNRLDPKVAAVEILNILRPIVAVAVYVCFTALAVIQQPEEREKLMTSEEGKLQRFVQEVRRFYPFFPFVPARAIRDFTWKGYEFNKGVLTILDLYGTNHHPKLWDQPELFNPDRFKDWNGSPFSFIPQGGGDHDAGHRCAGEWITLEIMKESADVLANWIRYEVPLQDLSFRFHDMPSLPHSRIIIRNVKRLNS